MSLLQQWQQKSQMLPAGQSVQKNGPGTPDYMYWPQNTRDVEAQMAQQASKKIQARLKVAKLFQQYRARLTSSQHDVTVSSNPESEDERICLTVYGNKRYYFGADIKAEFGWPLFVMKVVPLTVKNSGTRTVYLSFWASDLVKNVFTVRDCHGNIMTNRAIKQHTLGPGEVYKIKVHFHSDHAGFYEHLLVFKFETSLQSSNKFEIMRLLEVVHRRAPPRSEELLPTATNSLCDIPTAKWTPVKGVILMRRNPWVAWNAYAIPYNIRHLGESDMSLLKRSLNWEFYSRRFHLLLHLEELQLKTEIEKYNQDDVPMFRHKNNTDILILRVVSGVAKKPPLRLPGNQVMVTPLDQSRASNNTFYAGWLHHLNAEQVYLKFGEKFLSHFKEGMRVGVSFAINRMSLYMQHRAVAQACKQKLKEVLFPTGRLSSHHSHLHRLLEVESNPEQCLAIQHIVAATAKPAPYLIFGPPGTGKTVTLVEAIKQIVKTQASCTILACAPSNSATDHLCKNILEGKIGKSKLFRLYALSWPVQNIPKNIKFCCNLNQDTNTLIIPPKEELMKYKIMVTTLLTAGRLVTAKIPPGHYTYIFVDEAGQATETECIIPIAGLLNPQICQVVLAGDPKQLGPIVTSRMAVKHGLGVSLLERLMRDIDLYKSHEIHGFNHRFVTKLLRNYRSHPAILKIPNELFYEGELQPYAHKEKCSPYRKWERMPKKDFPLIFHGVAGINERDANSPSVYNIAEVEVLKEYLKSLIDHLHKKGVTKIEPGEIGIIAPYRKQVEKIQNALRTDKGLRKENLENILVGTVEQFQGKEFNVILVSTVRSNPTLTVCDQRFTLGFVTDEKRFNVAMTRAQTLLIVVGDPRVLITNRVWNKFIHYCYKEGAYRGITVSDAEVEVDGQTTELSQTVREE